MLGLPILYFRGMRLMMFQLSGFCCKASGLGCRAWASRLRVGRLGAGLPGPRIGFRV